ncbi:MAG: RsmB/NOP family class I SAM-dependent RNA methyltransferase [Coriobacteriia bacterium]|nr:RsmB/NOP family class I SAM-dependent RNA methyltransferase [Coriobacteriia bacterium]
MLPDFFTQALALAYSAEDAQRVIDGCQQRRAVSLRANTLKSDAAAVGQALSAAGLSWQSVPWYTDAFLLENARERELWDLPLYQEGHVYLQSLSSMLPPLVLAPAPGTDILDMCAAPGGKTTQMAALGGKQAHITACEMNGPRVEKLEYNLCRQGASNVTVMRQDARRLDSFFSFDAILVDAPCSGSGTLFAQDPKLAKRFTPQLLQKSQKNQAALLTKALELVKPGGTVVYSTCSVLPCENEDIVSACLKKANKRGFYQLEPIQLPGADCLPLLPCTLPQALTLCPTPTYEGFFVAKIVRKG